MFYLGIAYLSSVNLESPGSGHPETTQPLSANCTQWVLRICWLDWSIMSYFKKSRDFSLVYFLCVFLSQIYGRSRQVVRDFGFQDHGSLVKYYFIITNIHIVFYCHLWLHPFGLAGEDRVNKWSSIPIFLQTLHHFMNIWRSQVSVPCVMIPLFVNKKRLINAHSPVIWELSQYHWFKHSVCVDAARGLPCINYYGSHTLKKKKKIMSLKSTSLWWQ